MCGGSATKCGVAVVVAAVSLLACVDRRSIHSGTDGNSDDTVIFLQSSIRVDAEQLAEETPVSSTLLGDALHDVKARLEKISASAKDLSTADCTAVHPLEMQSAMRQLEHSMRAVSSLVMSHSSSKSESVSSATTKTVNDATGLSTSLLHLETSESGDPLTGFLVGSVIMLGIHLILGESIVDLFSLRLYSRLRITLAFMAVIMGCFELISKLDVFSTSSGNPFSLYLELLAICGAMVFRLTPLTLGSHPKESKWMVIPVLFNVSWNCWQACCMDRFFWMTYWTKGQEPASRTSFVFVKDAIYFALILATLVECFQRFGLLAKSQSFYERHMASCVDYAKSVLGGRGDQVEIPVPFIAAIAIPILVSGVAVMIGVLRLGLNMQHAIDMWFESHFYKGTLKFLVGSVEHADVRFLQLLAIGHFCIGFIAVAQAWLMWRAYDGYKRLFKKVARGQSYPGSDDVKRNGVHRFEVEGATSVGGSLLGTSMVFIFGSGMIIFAVLVIVTSSLFWELILGYSNYMVLFACVYGVRSLISNLLMHHIVTSDGDVLRPTSWALIYPTFLVYNSITGMTAGVVRMLESFVINMPTLLKPECCLLPSGWEKYDSGYWPFLCLVLHAHRTANPIMLAFLYNCERSMDIQGQDGSMAKRGLTRARIRWHLALLLVRNPSLRRWRHHALKAKLDGGETSKALEAEIPATLHV